jgi:hypothetical protein
LLFDLNDLTIDEAVLFAFRYRLIDDCYPEGACYRLTLGNQSLILAQDELAAYLHTLLRRHRRILEESIVSSFPGLGLN